MGLIEEEEEEDMLMVVEGLVEGKESSTLFMLFWLGWNAPSFWLDGQLKPEGDQSASDMVIEQDCDINAAEGCRENG